VFQGLRESLAGKASVLLLGLDAEWLQIFYKKDKHT